MWKQVIDSVGISKLVKHREKKMREAIKASMQGDDEMLQSAFVTAAQNIEALAFEQVSAPANHAALTKGLTKRMKTMKGFGAASPNSKSRVAIEPAAAKYEADEEGVSTTAS